MRTRRLGGAAIPLTSVLHVSSFGKAAPDLASLATTRARDLCARLHIPECHVAVSIRISAASPQWTPQKRRSKLQQRADPFQDDASFFLGTGLLSIAQGSESTQAQPKSGWPVCGECSAPPGLRDCRSA